MSLKPYWRKRNFNNTPEPRGRPGSGEGAGLYVIQQHAASRLHYDFRLELDGTLKVGRSPRDQAWIRRRSAWPSTLKTIRSTMPSSRASSLPDSMAEERSCSGIGATGFPWKMHVKASGAGD